jgi:hypothetical protein
MPLHHSFVNSLLIIIICVINADIDLLLFGIEYFVSDVCVISVKRFIAETKKQRIAVI